MSLYRIILVDDEEEVRKGIIRKIDWEGLGFMVVGDAANGEDALEMIEQRLPDVVMTDIRMPFMDGLTLTEKIRQRYPAIKVLIFSGFDDFEYAQQAIKLNVSEYILKPVNVEELSQILTKVRHSLDEEIEQRRNVDILRESYRSSLPILKELFLNDLVRGQISESKINRQLEEYEIDLGDARKWLAAVIDIERGENPEYSEDRALAGHQELIPISLKKLLEDSLKDRCRMTVFNTSTGLTMIAAIDENNSQTGLIDLLSDVCRESRRILEVTITIGVGHSCESLEQIGKSYQSAIDALGYKAIVGEGKTIYINDVEPVSRGRLQMDTHEESDLNAVIKFGTPEKIAETIHNLITRMGDAKVHLRQHELYKMSMVNCITRLIQQYDLDPGEIFPAPEDYLDIMSVIRQKDEFETWLNDVCLRMNEALNRERDNTAKKVIVEAKQYIQDNYQNPELSVEMLCRQLHMSPAYFSTMFKRETGQTYIGYLTDVRLNRAVELLNGTDDKTYVIAQKVGYQEQNYFSYVFKKRFGVSPTKFRGKSGE